MTTAAMTLTENAVRRHLQRSRDLHDLLNRDPASTDFHLRHRRLMRPDQFRERHLADAALDP